MTVALSRRAFLTGGTALTALLASGIPLRADIKNIIQTEFSFEDGDSKAWISVDSAGEGFTYFAPHNNETTSMLAGFDVMRKHGGRLVQIAHYGKRNLPVLTQGREMLFDPNRMFTDVGIEKTLKRLNKTHSRGLHEQIRAFAQHVLEHLNVENLHKGVIVGLHNNTPGGYSIKSYEKGKSDAKEAKLVHINPAHDADDFFFVISRAHFDKLKALNYNVVLQDNENMTDDGSLSVYCAQQGIGYVNVEAKHGRRAFQRRMIEELIGIL